eukprot:COSAG01_NODE_11309_length_1961_cov_29.163265_1_plen_213_part_00
MVVWCCGRAAGLSMGGGLVAELKDLAALREAGALTAAEYNQAKGAVLLASSLSSSSSSSAAASSGGSAARAAPAATIQPPSQQGQSKQARRRARKRKSADGGSEQLQQPTGLGGGGSRTTSSTTTAVAPTSKTKVKKEKQQHKPSPGARTAKYRAQTVAAVGRWVVGQELRGAEAGEVFGGNAGSGTFRTGFPGVGLSCLQVPTRLRARFHW